ncbi:MAG: hypothetical protein M3167_06630 [Acidobacteriota bacterium]|nr:hypothetical protein [Acidobacteriota bacterium]
MSGRDRLVAHARDAREIARRYAESSVEEAARGRHVRGSRILKARFLEVQARTLEAIAAGSDGIGCNADGSDDPARIDWLVRVIDVFQSSLLHHLAGRMPFDAGSTALPSGYSDWMEAAVVRGVAAGAWWNEVDLVLDDLYRASGPLFRRRRIRIGGRVVGRAAPAILAASALMAYHHMAHDLRVALTRHGIGHDADWASIARVSEEAQRNVFADRIHLALGYEWGRRSGLNVNSWRNRSRELARDRIVKSAAGRATADVLRDIAFEGLVIA